jgi:hypothetical protein
MPDRLRRIAWMAVAGGIVGSLLLMLRVGPRAPAFLLVVFALWIAAPFAAIVIAGRFTTRWPARARSVLYLAAPVLAVVSLAIYGSVAFGPPRPQPAFLFVVVPPASLVALGLAVWIAARTSPARA